MSADGLIYDVVFCIMLQRAAGTFLRHGGLIDCIEGGECISYPERIHSVSPVASC